MKTILRNLLIEIQKQNKEGKVYLETIDSCEGVNTVSVFAVKTRSAVRGKRLAVASRNLDYLFSITVNDRLYEKYLR